MFGTRAKKTVPGELLQGTLDMLILKTLSRGALHGYAIAESIAADLRRRAARRGRRALSRPSIGSRSAAMLTSEWGVSDNNRRAKFYRLTAAGRRQLADEASYWARMTAGIARIMETA